MSETLTTSAELQDLIESTVTIPTIPTILNEISRIFASADGSAQEAAEVIDKDPAISAKLLRLVNSSIYSLRNPVSAVPLACSIVGLKVIKNLVVQATVLDQFSDCPELERFSATKLWDHSFKTATAARLLVEHSQVDFGIAKDEAYTCGLVHDVGKMMLLQSRPEQFAEALRHSRSNHLPLAKAEAELFGFSHAHVGGMLAQRWQLSHDLQVAVMYHHSAGVDAGEWAQGFLIQAANSIAHQVQDGDGGWLGDTIDNDALSVLAIGDEAMAEILEEVAAASIEI